MQEKVMDEYEKWVEMEMKCGPFTCTMERVLAKYRAFKAKAVEPLAVLADRKGAYIAWEAEYEGEWHIGIDGTRINQMDFKSPTYFAAEEKAREWLNKQEDK